ncbi:MAG TPA: LysM peptidoglycan-binding domain-containing protein, partial [Kribbella sp.]
GATTQGQHSRTGKPATPGKPSTQEQHTGSDSTTVNPPAAGHGNGSSQGTTGATGNQAGSGDSDRTSTGRTGDTRSSSIAGAGDSRRTSTGRPSGGEGPAGTGQQPGGRGQVGVPDRPTDGAPTRYTDLRPAVPVSVVVRAGDSLWSIAARELGPSATNEAIAARWHDWYSANRHVIGNDPDLILPGQVLRTPPAPHGDRLPPHQQEQ